MENKTQNTQAEGFDKPLQNSGPNQQPLGQPSTGSPSKQERQRLELRKDPMSTSGIIGQELEDHPGEEEAEKISKMEGILWGPIHVFVRDRSNSAAIPDGCEFIISVEHHVYEGHKRYDDLIDTLPAKTFSQVEQIVTELREKYRSYPGVDWFWLNWDHDDPRLVQLSAKLGLVERPDKSEDEEAA